MLTREGPSNQRWSRLRGRSQRTQSIGTKLTCEEETKVLSASEEAGKVPSEWVRELILREFSGASRTDSLLAEILGVRLLLVNVLRPVAAGQQMKAEEFDKLLDEISSAKFELAARLNAEVGREHDG